MSESPYYFDAKAAKRAERFFEEYLHHFKGRHDGQPFLLLPWERKIIRDIFGWKRRSDRTRRYRVVYIEVPRKNGKSALCAGIALYLLCADDEGGAEVYSAACTTDQSSICFDAAKKMVERSPRLQKYVDVKRWHIEHPRSGSVYRALSGENVGKHGKNPHGLIIDELHEWKGEGARQLHEALITAMGARTQPLTVYITTAGTTSEETICLEMHETAVKYLSGEIEPGDEDYDDTFYAAIFGAAKDDPWDAETIWTKANPSIGHTVTIDFLRKECIKARKSAREQNSFRRLYLNQWTEQTTRWIALDKWDACTREIDPDELAGLISFIGLDLSQSFDFGAAVSIYTAPDKWLVVPRLYIPNATARDRYQEQGTQIPEWIEQGHVIGMETETLDYERISDDIGELTATGTVKEIAVDRYNATTLTNRFERAGVAVVPVHQTFLGMSAAAKEFERRMIVGKSAIVIADNPALRWMAANVEVESDRHGNIRPVKPKRKGKYAGTRNYSIDGIVAAVIATSRAMLHDTHEAIDDQRVYFIG